MEDIRVSVTEILNLRPLKNPIENAGAVLTDDRRADHQSDSRFSGDIAIDGPQGASVLLPACAAGRWVCEWNCRLILPI
jgi:hypothetical protein